MRRCVALALAAVALAACDKAAPSRKVTVSSTADATRAIVDEDYRFRLDWPGEGWKLVGADEISRVAPDALAGAIRTPDIFGIVIVESAKGVELQSFVRHLTDNMPLEDPTPVERENIRFVDREAVRFRVTGSMQGMRFLFCRTVFLHRDHAYQVVAWALADRVPADGSAFQPFFDSFSLLDGEVTGRARTATVRDTRGVGWRLKDGAFESAVTGISVRPAPGWHVAVGAELEQMNADAEVGLVHTNPDVYVALLPETWLPADPDSFAAKLLASFASDVGASPDDEPLSLPFAGETLPFRTLRSAGPLPFEYLHAVRIRGESVVQVMAWHVAGAREEARKALPAALGSVGFLSPEQQADLSAEMAALPDPENAVGPGWSLRAGVFRGFEEGVEWRKPRGFWRVKAGEGARAQNEDATLYLTEAARGLCALVIVDDGAEWTGREYHDTVVEAMLGPRDGGDEPLSRTLGDAPALVTDGRATVRGLEIGYRIATALRGDKAVQFLVWAQPDALRRESDAVDAAIGGLRLGELRPLRQEGSRFTDLRLGYAIDPPAGWVRRDRTPEAIGPVGSFYQWEGRGGFVGVLAVCAIQPGQDERWFLDFVEQVVRDENRAALGSAAPAEAEGALGGLRSRRLTWKGLWQTTEVDLVLRDHTLYAVITGARGLATEAAATARGTFTLLD